MSLNHPPVVDDATRREFLAVLAATGLLAGCGAPTADPGTARLPAHRRPHRRHRHHRGRPARRHRLQPARLGRAAADPLWTALPAVRAGPVHVIEQSPIAPAPATVGPLNLDVVLPDVRTAAALLT